VGSSKTWVLNVERRAVEGRVKPTYFYPLACDRKLCLNNPSESSRSEGVETMERGVFKKRVASEWKEVSKYVR